MVSNTNSDYLPAARENEFLPPISRWTTYGGLFILFVLGLSVPVASVAKYKVTVKGQAVVRPAGELRLVQANAEGQIMQIYVKGNQVVKKGDAIATIDDSRLQTKKNQLQTSNYQARLQLAQITAQIRSLDNQILAEQERNKRTIASVKAELQGHNRAYQEKKVTTVTEYQEADANVKIAQEELSTAEAQLKSARSNLGAVQATLGAAKSKHNRYKSIAHEGALSKDQYEEALLSVKQQEQAVEAQKAVVEAQEKTIARMKQAVEVAIARRQRTQVTLNPSNSEVAIATERIAQEKAVGEVSQATLEKERQALTNQKIEIQKQLDRDNRELKQLEIDLSQTNITATADGIISKLNLRNSGQTVRMGEEIAQIVPDNAPLIVKTAIEPEAKSKVKVGQKVQMRVSACPYPEYGTLNGKVKAISPDAVNRQVNNDGTNSNSPPVAAAFYEITVEPETLNIGNRAKKCQIQLGMDGRADIITREETVLQFFLRQARLISDL
ncbi:HlyD family efflux transporter periplasmic adaptor subunit [Calothrix sp. 336/3]|uniref:HlyD family efflux transporter periplasmic adaptor subunit n=1 Tax=Calothrix sp. 336/3 TaxID=1337936 RepID=UPI0004E39F53|nr:HlyD family efflux transporter periplasmic adaptor subunit [Calothrix sp. 336/3]AKG22638.1 hemolysin D [Calothrix sp. 336/3]